MSALKPIIRELKDAALRGGAHAKDKLPHLTRNINDRLDTVVRRVRDADRFDDAIDVNLKRFKRNKKHDSAEYHRQYNEQMDTLQNMSAADWLRNRIEYLENGRTPDSVRAQQNARDYALQQRILELRREGQSRDEAKQNALEWLTTQAATHRLDGIAGGDITDISGVGDARVNSSLGSQWRSRVDDIDRAVIDYINAHPGVDLNKISINVLFR
ncbi:polymorphic toxin type 15 domain-containing protein [Microbacterium aurum]|uniref:polymorphic toxin type 15 domain-containing protein n=1 Tax=Microbacterium aurum TaxID=36805 RepID=UPI001EF5E092|nr:polymorphic toxin type 15 domain-containing protein [Microbacterium aurum]MCG7413492.1 polymorphic toxin type 15 domain-containing protein [Microbacterium aurum]